MSTSTYYPAQAYGNYAQQYSGYPSQTAQYAGQYTAAAGQGQPQTAAYPYPPSAMNSPVVKTPGSPALDPPGAPDLAEVNEDVALRAVQRVVSSELRHAEFDTAVTSAIHRLELETIAFVEQIFQRAHEYANHASRARPLATDIMLACKEFYGMEIKHLHKFEMLSKKRRLESSEPEPLILIPPPSRSPSPELLASDDEGVGPSVPTTLRMLPHSQFLPPLPPKHTYLRTPASPPRKAALPSLEKKLKNASLVQESLKNLLLATEENADNEDGEILGAVVNWEPTVYPRKRWKLGTS